MSSTRIDFGSEGLQSYRTLVLEGLIEESGVDRIIVWGIYEMKGDKIAVVTLLGQRTDPQTGRFIEWLKSKASAK